MSTIGLCPHCKSNYGLSVASHLCKYEYVTYICGLMKCDIRFFFVDALVSYSGTCKTELP